MPRQVLYNTCRRNSYAFPDEPGELLITVRTTANAAASCNNPMPRNEVAFIFRKLRQHRDRERSRNADLRREALRRRDASERNFGKKRQQLGFRS